MSPQAEDGYECPKCTSVWSTSIAADECCNEKWERGRE